jgi:Ca2+-binding RTX toxin-like protein
MDGGTGTADLVDYTGTSSNLNVSLDNVANDGVSGEGDNVKSSVEKVQGGSGDDTLSANFAAFTGNAVLDGAGGNDTIIGGSANDTLFGEGGNDSVVGNGGNDSLDGGSGNNVFDAVDGQADTLHSTGGVDTLNFDQFDTIIIG